MRHRHARRGFTLLEILVVLALFLILGTIVIPSISGVYGNTRQKVAADVLRARLSDARALAMETGVPYRIAISGDNTKIRVAPDGLEFASMSASTQASAQAKAIETTLEKATAEREIDPDEPPAAADSDGWQTIATFLPDGTCKEDIVTVRLLEGQFPPLRIQVRGVTGGSRTLPQTTQPTTQGAGP